MAARPPSGHPLLEDFNAVPADEPVPGQDVYSKLFFVVDLIRLLIFMLQLSYMIMNSS